MEFAAVSVSLGLSAGEYKVDATRIASLLATTDDLDKQAAAFRATHEPTVWRKEGLTFTEKKNVRALETRRKNAAAKASLTPTSSNKRARSSGDDSVRDVSLCPS